MVHASLHALNTALNEEPEGRYQLHELLRQYAEEQLREDAVTICISALRLSQRAADQITICQDGGTTFSKAETEHVHLPRRSGTSDQLQAARLRLMDL